MGYLASSQLTQTGYLLAGGTTPTFTATDTTAYDGLGNIRWSAGGWALPPTAVSVGATNTYNAANRLSLQTTVSGATARTTVFAYDAGGNTRFEATSPSGGSNTVEERAAFYSGNDQVIAVDKRVSGRRMVEEFRYDALGRRVWVSTKTSCAPPNDISCLTNAVRRVIWDGSEALAEIQAPLDTTNATVEELDTGFPTLQWVALGGSSAVSDPNPFYGRVVYAPGLATDQPMSVTRYEYQDNPQNTNAHVWPRMTILVFWDYRGAPVYGLFDNGAWTKPYTLGVNQTACPVVGSTTDQRCVLQQWPFAQSAYDKARGAIQYPSWHGSLLRNQQDGTGLEYHRHRLYDPKTGRFTQEDPIGLAGGLNLYGYANGDPVNFSDPFGLCVPWCTAAIGAAIGGGGAALGTMWYNHSQGRPLSENVGRNALVGAGAGAAVGLGVGLFGGGTAAGAAAAGVTVGPGTQRLIQNLESAGRSMGGRIDAVMKSLPQGNEALLTEIEGGVMMSGGSGARARQIIIEESGRTIVKAFDVAKKVYETVRVIDPK